MADKEIAQLALRCLDLTELTDTCTSQAIDALCAKALRRHGPVAAVCVWPQFITRARDALRGSGVRIATVVNFPAGGEDIGRITDDVREALGDGANEIDLVLPYEALRRGNEELPTEMVAAVRDVVDGQNILKVILETGKLVDPVFIEQASRISIDAGADFIKTSTGKTPISATPEAVEIMLNAIKASGRKVGLKPSGGIRTVADAALYLGIADRIMGRGWATPQTFRIGASSLYDALIAELEGTDAAPSTGTY